MYKYESMPIDRFFAWMKKTAGAAGCRGSGISGFGAGLYIRGENL
jgi:hypothetical protein